MKRFIPIFMLVALLTVAVMPGFASEVNIAKECPVTVSPSPNYGNTGNILSSLTDGEHTSGVMWMQKGAVGWSEVPIVSITVDLKKVQPISGVSFSTGSGDDSVQWPGSLFIWVSDNGIDWHYVGDLISLSEKQGVPQAENYADYTFSFHGLRTKGQYIRICAIPGNAFIFCDEIEVYKGGNDLLSLPTIGKPIQDTDAKIREMYFSSRIIYRLSHDADAVQHAILLSAISNSRKKLLLSRLDEIAALIPAINRQETNDFESVLPIDNNDVGIFAVYGSLLKLEGCPSLFAWKKDRYDFLKPAEVPGKSAKDVKLSISMMRNEYRSDAVLITNASNSDTEVKIKVEGIPGGSKPECLRLYAMPWTDTAVGIPVSAALVPLKFSNGSYDLRLHAGMTSRLWATVNSQKLASGNYTGRLKIRSVEHMVIVPFEIHVSKVIMNRPRLSFCAWDYCFKTGSYAVNKDIYHDALAQMQSHYIDSPWIQGYDLPTPAADSYDSEGNLVKPLIFEDFDRWVSLWHDARHYLVYPNSPTELCGYPMGSEGFNKRVGSWMKALATHMYSIGKRPEDLGLMIRDEPDEESQKVIIGWAKAVKASNTGIQIYQDCNTGMIPEKSTLADALRSADVTIPMLGAYYGGIPETQLFYQGQLKAGKKMWFYQCEGPGRMLDPYRYYRLGGWHCFKNGASGIGLWAFGDIGHYKNSWNQYSWVQNEYTPLFFRPNEITESISWEACREGIEDYEYLAMLKDAAARTKDPILTRQANQVLMEAPDAVCGKFKTFRYRWNANPESAKADIYRLKILHLLEKIK